MRCRARRSAMNPLAYIKQSAAFDTIDKAQYRARAQIALVTNFTDDLLRKIFIGAALERGIYPIVTAHPYKQYHFDLAGPEPVMDRSDADITYFVFDAG